MTDPASPVGTGFHQRFTRGVMQLVLDICMTEDAAGQRTAVVPVNEAVDSLVAVMAVLLRNHEEASTPTKLRRLADSFARQLQRDVTAARREESPFETIYLPRDGVRQ